MEKKKKEAIIFIVLIFVAVIMVMRMMLKAEAPLSSQVETSPAIGKQADIADFFELEEKLKGTRPKLDYTRDPFQFQPRKAAGKVGIDRLSLTGIIYDQESPVAVINDTIVHKGEEIEGALILEIKSNSVVLEKDGKSYTLELIKPEE